MWWIFLGISIVILTPGDFGDQPTVTAMGLTYTPGKLLELRPDSCHLLDHAAWRSACDAGIALRYPTRRGCRGGARKQRKLASPIVTGQSEVTTGTTPLRTTIDPIQSQTTTPDTENVNLPLLTADLQGIKLN